MKRVFLFLASMPLFFVGGCFGFGAQLTPSGDYVPTFFSVFGFGG